MKPAIFKLKLWNKESFGAFAEMMGEEKWINRFMWSGIVCGIIGIIILVATTKVN